MYNKEKQQNLIVKRNYALIFKQLYTYNINKIDRKFKIYEECPLKYEKGDLFIEYINNRHLLKGRPNTFQHGDYHIGNMMINKNHELVVIDLIEMTMEITGKNLIDLFGVFKYLMNLQQEQQMVISIKKFQKSSGNYLHYL